mmetsp:Transcript_58226/g.104915  ORF Transcript_58226/g.104915 Transcript_58226/m.104915 type:complete len:252 (+) Transcript_58226:2-757(+)
MPPPAGESPPPLPAKPEQGAAPQMKNVPSTSSAPKKFSLLPSVGTWLAPKPLRAAEVAPPSAAPPAAVAVAAPALAPKPKPGPADFRTVNLDTMQKLYKKFPATPMPQSAPTPSSKPELSTAPEVKSAPCVQPKFGMRPSVGTWLAPNPAKLHQAKFPAQTAPAKTEAKDSSALATSQPAVPMVRKPFRQLPSVGTWLAFKPFDEPQPVSIRAKSHQELLEMNKEELITGYESEITKLSKELAALKAAAKL